MPLSIFRHSDTRFFILLRRLFLGPGVVQLLLLLYNNNDNNKHLFIPPSCVFLFGSHTRVFSLFFPFLFYLSFWLSLETTWHDQILIQRKEEEVKREREKALTEKWHTPVGEKKGEKLSRVDKESRRTVSVKKNQAPRSRFLSSLTVTCIYRRGRRSCWKRIYLSAHTHTHTQSLLNEKKMVKTTTATTEKVDYVCVDDDDDDERERERPP